MSSGLMAGGPAWLDRAWRRLATGWGFFLLFFGGFVMALTALPLTRARGQNPIDRDTRARRLIRRVWRFYIRHLQRLGVLTLSVSGLDKLDPKRSHLIVANHPSLLDVVLLLSLIPNCTCVVKQSLWRNRWLRGVVRAAGYIGNADSESLLAGCRAARDAGQSILVFPEGTRSMPGAPLRFQRGAAHIAVRCGLDIVPIVITCRPPTLLKGEPWYKIPPRRPHFHIQVGDTISVARATGGESTPSRATRKLHRVLEHYYQGALAHE